MQGLNNDNNKNDGGVVENKSYNSIPRPSIATNINHKRETPLNSNSSESNKVSHHPKKSH